MSINDIATGSALVISIISLLLSLWNSRFNRSAKLSELRAAVLAKAAEASSRLAHIYELELNMRLHAEAIGDNDAALYIDLVETRGIREQLDRTYDSMSSMPHSKGLALHQGLFDIFQRLAEDAARIEREIQYNHDKYLEFDSAAQVEWSDGNLQSEPSGSTA